MSTTLEIGRMPAASRRAASHSGEGPTVTCSNTRAVKRGHSSGHSTTTLTPSGSPSSEPGSSLHGGCASGAPVAACTSRATPYTARQSGRFGVTSSSRTSVPSGSTCASGVPGAGPSSSTSMPAWSPPSASSSVARIIPSLRMPRSFAAPSVRPSASFAPGRATATVWPAATFGAPQTIVTGPSSPTSTVQTRSRSALGCWTASSTRPTT